jgi:hypothetical protein
MEVVAERGGETDDRRLGQLEAAVVPHDLIEDPEVVGVRAEVPVVEDREGRVGQRGDGREGQDGGLGAGESDRARERASASGAARGEPGPRQRPEGGPTA